MITHFSRNAFFWIALAFLVVSIAAISVVAYQHHKESKLEGSGSVITGTVDSKRIEIRSDHPMQVEEFLVANRFKAPDGTSQSGEGLVDPSFYDTVEAGDEIEVLYDTNDPSRHRLGATEPVGCDGTGSRDLVAGFCGSGCAFCAHRSAAAAEHSARSRSAPKS